MVHTSVGHGVNGVNGVNGTLSSPWSGSSAMQSASRISCSLCVGKRLPSFVSSTDFAWRSDIPVFSLAEMPRSEDCLDMVLETDWGYSVSWQDIPKLHESSGFWGEDKIDSSDSPRCMVSESSNYWDGG